MDQLYANFRKQAHDLEYHAHDLIDNHAHPQARALKEEFRRLTEDFERRREPRTIENRINVIQQQLKQVQHTSDQYMSINDSVALHEHMRHMRDNIRRFPNY